MTRPPGSQSFLSCEHFGIKGLLQPNHWGTTGFVVVVLELFFCPQEVFTGPGHLGVLPIGSRAASGQDKDNLFCLGKLCISSSGVPGAFWL